MFHPAGSTEERADPGTLGHVPVWKVPLLAVEIGPVERDLVAEALAAGRVGTAGPDIDSFETELERFTGAGAVVAVASASAALNLALAVLGVQRGDEVLVSDLARPHAGAAVVAAGAHPCLVDCEPDGWHLDPNLLADELRRRAHRSALPAAVVCSHLYGSMADVGRIAATCEEYGVPLVEDATSALGAMVNGVPAGRTGALGVLGFDGPEIVTAGTGGALLSHHVHLVDHARHLAGRDPHSSVWPDDTEIVTDLRIGNLQAALGRGQLRTLPQRTDARRRVRNAYERSLGAAPGIRFQAGPEGVEPNHWLTVVSVDPVLFGATADEVVAALHAERIDARRAMTPVHMRPAFAGAERVGGGVAERVTASCVCLPSGAALTEADVAWIADVLVRARGERA